MPNTDQHENRSKSIGSSQNRGASVLWHPSNDDEAATEVIAKIKIKKVGRSGHVPNTLDRIKRTWFGRLYVNHLKRISIIRSSIIWLWRNFYPLYVNVVVIYFYSKLSRRWRPLVKLNDHVKELNLSITKVFDETEIYTPAPKVFPIEDQTYLVPPHELYVFPSVYVAELNDSLVYGGTNLIFTRSAAVCHDLYDFKRDYTSEELHGRHVIDVKKMRMRLLLHDSLPEKIDSAATFVDACAANYAHWLTEVLPRIATFCSQDMFENIPIIINDGLHSNIMESLALIVGADREVIVLPVGRGVLVNKLYVTSVTGYVPFERRDAKLKNHSHGLFCPSAFQLVRDKLVSCAERLQLQELPRKIYLKRSSATRQMENGDEVERALLKGGYDIVEPEKYSFLQQVALFNSADEIVGSSGAALANLIFMPSMTSVRIFIGRFEGTSYWYWQNIACASGKVISYTLGALKERGAGIHSSFTIDIENLEHDLKELE